MSVPPTMMSPPFPREDMNTWLNVMTGNVLPGYEEKQQTRTPEEFNLNYDSIIPHLMIQMKRSKTDALLYEMQTRRQLDEENISRGEMEKLRAMLELQASINQLTKPANPATDGMSQRLEQVETQMKKELQDKKSLIEALHEAVKCITDLKQERQADKDELNMVKKELRLTKGRLLNLQQQRQTDKDELNMVKNELKLTQDQLLNLQQQRQADKEELNRVKNELKQVHDMGLHCRAESPPPSQCVSPIQSQMPGADTETHQCNVLQGRHSDGIDINLRRSNSNHGATERKVCSSSSQVSVSFKQLDRMARNIDTFKPSHPGDHDIHAYLRDIDFHLKMLDQATSLDAFCLIRITSSPEVRCFLDRQPDKVKADYKLLCEELIKEFSDPESEHDLMATMNIRQGRKETPQAYYSRLRKSYFGPRNEPEMEEDKSFKTLFLQNLHPSLSHYLGVDVCPRTMTSRQLRDLALKGHHQQKKMSKKQAETTVLCSKRQDSDSSSDDANVCIQIPTQPRRYNEGWRRLTHRHDHGLRNHEPSSFQRDPWKDGQYSGRRKPSGGQNLKLES